MTEDNETPYEALTRIKKAAERTYLNLTAQGDPRLASVRNTNTYLAARVAELAFGLHEIAGFLGELVEPAVEAPPAPEVVSRELLRRQSMRMRVEAAARFSDRLQYLPGSDRWSERATGRLVVFTPNGWRVETDVYGTPDYDIYVP